MISNVIKNILYTDMGRIILSIILGLGLATLFRQMCKGKDCHKFIGPEHNAIRDKIFSYDDNNNKCFKLKENMVKCGERPKTIEFA